MNFIGGEVKLLFCSSGNFRLRKRGHKVSVACVVDLVRCPFGETLFYHKQRRVKLVFVSLFYLV
jgi:hypothetical protein